MNPSYEAVTRLPDKIGDAEIIKMEIPTVRGKSIEVLTKKIEEIQLDAVVSLGQSGGADSIRVERVAINVDDYRIPDNEGNRPSDEPVFTDGPNAYFSTLPIKKIRDAIQAKDIPVVISNSAGTFVCNHLFYGIRHLCETKYSDKGIISGFLHVPYIPAQTKDKPKEPSMELDDIVAGLTAALEVIAR